MKRPIPPPTIVRVYCPDCRGPAPAARYPTIPGKSQILPHAPRNTVRIKGAKYGSGCPGVGTYIPNHLARRKPE